MPRCRAIAAEKREAVSVLYQEGMKKREIARLLRTTPHTVRRIIKQKGVMPRSVRGDKIQIAPELLRELHKQCNGEALLVHKILTEKHGIQVGYSTLTRSLRRPRPPRRPLNGKEKGRQREVAHGDHS